LNIKRSEFHVFDRESLEYLTTFKGETTEYTDGVWLSQESFGPFSNGAFYAVHDDKQTTAFQWDDIATTLEL
jgi:3-phytase